ncbi:MAG: putative 2-dehydropantoate 2-reductase [Oscillatoriales cyanobacterium RM2_1_1]|nr:putative 2-dehydropantoate 2-reductase [Oscillatoriales cyanobacterium SM2_3_0]NJO45477.1 putative 2-dehydropantoate 2-reductase [Oscillatoriales cyanobacterium RM2_1_1]
MPTRSYAIVGTGAIGGFYGAKLQRGRFAVHFLLHRDYEYVCRQGLKVESPDGDLSLLEVQAYARAQDMPICDVVIIALKTTYNFQLREILPHIVGPETVILVLQNGLGTEAEIAEMVGDQAIVGGLCFICSNKVGPGHIQHLDYGAVTLAEYLPDYQRAGQTQRLEKIAEDFKQADIPIELSPDLLLARWKKLVWNIPYNGLSVILNARTDEIMSHSATRLVVEEIMQEVLQGAKACDRPISPEFIRTMLDHTENMKPYLTSMKLDYERKQPLELEAIFGNPLRRAAMAGIKLSRIEILYRQLKFLDDQNRSD